MGGGKDEWSGIGWRTIKKRKGSGRKKSIKGDIFLIVLKKYKKTMKNQAGNKKRAGT